MGINNSTVEKTSETAAEFQGSGKSTGFENVKNIIADKLHNAAGALSEKVAIHDANDAQCGMASSRRPYGYLNIKELFQPMSPRGP